MHIRSYFVYFYPLRRIGHGSHTGVDLPKQTIHVLIPAEYVSQSRAGGHLCGQCFCHLYIQRHWMIDITKMFLTVCVMAMLIPTWGMIGLWTDKIGFHNAWEFWVYSVVYGLVIGPNYSLTQTLMAELTPRGFEYMFFGLFGLSNRSASIIGPNVIQAIISKDGNNWKAFPVLFVFSALGCLMAWLGVDVPKGHGRAVGRGEARDGCRHGDFGGR